MKPAHDLADPGFLAGAAAAPGTQSVAAAHRATSATAQPHNAHPGKPVKQISTVAPPTDTRRTA